ncbi:hypothetical protein AAG570_005398 [Ranatra chinensis]|uniref:Uncharacterized protein n=1 Tax=Ranatra chinensis TaxID=642074 RepID=A0ABD0YIK7_9HEMI
MFGHTSAAHLNPAVTLCFYVMGDITFPMLANYLLAELVGSILGFGVLMMLTPESIYSKQPGLCCTVPHQTVSDFQAFSVEFISTAFLILLVCSCSDPRNSKKQDSAPLKFGILIAALSLIAGPYTGASMNPTRSFAPAFWSQVWTSHWVRTLMLLHPQLPISIRVPEYNV